MLGVLDRVQGRWRLRWCRLGAAAEQQQDAKGEKKLIAPWREDRLIITSLDSRLGADLWRRSTPSDRLDLMRQIPPLGPPPDDHHDRDDDYQ